MLYYSIKIKKGFYMEHTTVLPKIEVDSSILVSLKNSADELANKMRLYTAIALYQKKQLSLGKAAQLAGVDRLEFINILQKEKVAIFDYDKNEIDEIFDDANKLMDILK